MADTLKKHVFMSYSRKDEAVMQRVAEFLRNQSINVWVDNEKLIPGTPIWEEEIEKAIISAGAIVVLLSPDAKNSPWVRREISYAEDNAKRIFPILIAGDERKTIPIRLTTHQRIDIRQNEDLGMKSLYTFLSSYLETLEFQQQRVKTEATERVARQKTEQDAAERAAREKAEQEAAQKVEQERKKFEEKARKEKEAGELHYEGMLAQKEGKFDEAEQLFQQSLRIAIDLEDDQGKASILNQLAILSKDREAKEKAEREAAEKKAAEKAAKEKAVKEAGELHYLGMLALKQGNFDEAESLFKQSLKFAIDLKDEQAKSNILHQLELLTQERLDRKKAEREAAEKAAKEKAEREAAEKAAKEKAKREAAEKAAREKARREAAEKAAREKAKREAAEKVAREKATIEKAERTEAFLGGIVSGSLALFYIILYEGDFGDSISLAGLLLVVSYSSVRLAFPHKISVVFLLIGFIAGFILGINLSDYPENFILLGGIIGLPAGTILSWVLALGKVRK